MRVYRFVLVSLALIALFLCPLAINAAPPALPKDVVAGDADAEAIQFVIGKSLLVPGSGNVFGPDNAVTRSEFATVLAKARGIQAVKPSAPTFSDLKASDSSYPYVEALVKAGVIPVASSKKFEPEAPVKRADMAVWIINALGLAKEAASIKEPVLMANDEDKVPQHAIGAMTLAYRSDRQLLGYRRGRLAAPMEGATRREIAKAIYMMMNPPKRGGTIVTAFTAEPPGFNTLVTSSGATWTIDNIIGDGNTGSDQDGFYFPE